VILLAAFGALDWGIIVLYLLAVLGLGALAARGQEDEESYFLGGRSMPTWAVTLSIVATSLSAATYVGVPQLTFRGDLSYLILNIGGVLGALAVAAFMLPPLYRAGTTTIYGVLGQRYGEGATLAASVAFLVGRLLASGARLFMAGIAFSLILFNETSTASIVIAVIVFGVIGTAYTCMGGIRAVIWTDTLQIVLVVGAAIAAIAFLLSEIPLSTGEIYDHLSTRGKLTVVKTGFSDKGYDWAAGFTLLTAFAVMFQNAGSYGCDQDLVQRMMTTKSPWRSSVSLMLSQLIAMPVVLLFMVIGLLLSIYYGHPELMGSAFPSEPLADDRGVYPQFLVNHMPTGLAGLAMAGMFAAAMSSLDSAVNAMASSIVADVIEPIRRRRGLPERDPKAPLQTSRWVVIGTGALLVGFAVLATLVQAKGGQSLINFALGVMTFALSGLLGVFCTALFTKRGNVRSVVAALIVGALVIVVLYNYKKVIAWPWWMAIASPLSFLVCCLGAPDPQSDAEKPAPQAA
jgi:SSS family solute:Na+ symporter